MCPCTPAVPTIDKNAEGYAIEYDRVARLHVADGSLNQTQLRNESSPIPFPPADRPIEWPAKVRCLSFTYEKAIMGTALHGTLSPKPFLSATQHSQRVIGMRWIRSKGARAVPPTFTPAAPGCNVCRQTRRINVNGESVFIGI